jgi:hypothetical protein
MPCYTITTVSLELKNANLEMLKAALTKLGMYGIYSTDKAVNWSGGSYNKETGKLTVTNTTLGNRIKQAYSGEVVKSQAKRFGWQLKEVAENKYEIIKR